MQSNSFIPASLQYKWELEEKRHSSRSDMSGAEIVPVTLAVYSVVKTMWPLVSKLGGKFVRLFRGKPKRTNDTLNQLLERQAMRRQLEVSQRAGQAMRRQLEVSQRAGQAALKEAEAAKIALQQGIQPVVWPTPQQIKETMKMIKYDEEKFHFGVVGSSGSGKSSFINAVRGLANRHPNAAKVGQTETTATIHRYPDPRKDLPFSRIVWYDTPGAGTLTVPSWEYFNKQGLFVFDFLILVYDARFSQIDAGVIENCIRFHIPLFIVRSKADVHITNMVKFEDDLERGEDGFEERYQKRMTEFVSVTRSNFSKQIEIMKNLSQEKVRNLDRSDSKYAIKLAVEFTCQTWLSQQTVHIVSASQLLALHTDPNPKKPVDDSKTIDEIRLFENLLSVAAVRRYSEDNAEDKSFFKSLIPSGPAMFRTSNDRPRFQASSSRSESNGFIVSSNGLITPGYLI